MPSDSKGRCMRTRPGVECGVQSGKVIVSSADTRLKFFHTPILGGLLMLRTFSWTVAMAAALVVSQSASAQGEKSVTGPLEFTLKSIDGKDVPLKTYKGKVVMIVNVASQCGLTPQYKGLQKLYDEYAKEGLVIIGVPANEFGSQEPGTNDETKKFCESKY